MTGSTALPTSHSATSVCPSSERWTSPLTTPSVMIFLVLRTSRQIKFPAVSSTCLLHHWGQLGLLLWVGSLDPRPLVVMGLSLHIVSRLLVERGLLPALVIPSMSLLNTLQRPGSMVERSELLVFFHISSIFRFVFFSPFVSACCL